MILSMLHDCIVGDLFKCAVLEGTLGGSLFLTVPEVQSLGIPPFFTKYTPAEDSGQFTAVQLLDSVLGCFSYTFDLPTIKNRV